MDETIDAIIDASYLAMSIIIVGVGNANFDNMEELDADDGLLSNGRKKALRDIVQVCLSSLPSFISHFLVCPLQHIRP